MFVIVNNSLTDLVRNFCLHQSKANLLTTASQRKIVEFCGRHGRLRGEIALKSFPYFFYGNREKCETPPAGRFTNIPQPAKLREDPTIIMFDAKTFEGPILVTIAYICVYLTFCFGQSFTKFYLYFQARTKAQKDGDKSPISFAKIKYSSTDRLAITADRTVGNVSQQMPMFCQYSSTINTSVLDIGTICSFSFITLVKCRLRWSRRGYMVGLDLCVHEILLPLRILHRSPVTLPLHNSWLCHHHSFALSSGIYFVVNFSAVSWSSSIETSYIRNCPSADQCEQHASRQFRRLLINKPTNFLRHQSTL